MGGGLMQLVAYGAQDIYLTGNPQITFFKVVYRRHTNFAMESIEQTFNGAASLGNKFSCTISRNGDLLSRVYLEMDVTLSQTHTIKNITLKNGTPAENYTLTSAAAGNEGFSIGAAPGNVITVQDSAGATSTIQAGAADINSQNDLDGLNSAAPDTTNGGRRLGLRAINSVEVEIGGQCIDKHYGDWMDIWVGLSGNQQQWEKHNRLVNATLNSNTAGRRKIYVPLQFWFCRNPGLALPLIALQYHEVKINVQFNNSVSYTHEQSADTDDAAPGVDLKLAAATTIVNPAGGNHTDAGTMTVVRTVTDTLAIDTCCVFCDYIFLDTDERRRFAQVSHEYLIEQLQYSNALNLDQGSNQVELRFNHPVKEILWSAQIAANNGNNFNYFQANGNEMISKALLQLNGHDRFRERDGSYFRCVQPYQHHDGADGQSDANEWGGYYMYSFALKPDEHQPSGTCNFSRIDNAVLNLTANAGGVVKVYARNYNVLRIMSGMGGLAYSN